MPCDQCDCLNINGMNVHELGCPNAWKDEKRLCKECGRKFKPLNRHHRVCMDCINDFEGDNHGTNNT